MSIYIEGLNVPRWEPLIVRINPYWSANVVTKSSFHSYRVYSVDEHGDLIDRDAMIKSLDCDIMGIVKPLLDVRHTVIPANNHQEYSGILQRYVSNHNCD